VNGGLIAEGGRLKGFQVAADAGAFVEAEARIEGDTVVVWSEDVPGPVDVRYGWANAPDCTLYNKAGLPASPFRTDSRPGVTDGAR
jgi:sialate O-acetylesterase